ncbi:MAG: prolyl oligopeptidase family serine peptidase [Gemmataceae bacterium]|nr:prolyl oligopeptidase family serine peptidase [Gemmataceae bacterium]
MPRPGRLALFTLAVVGLSTSGLPARQPDQPTTGKIEKKTYEFKDAGKEMEYALFVPAKYDKEKKTPLIIALHGLGGTPQGIIRYRGFTDLAEKHGYIVAAPMGYSTGGWYGATPLTKRADDPPNLAELSEKDVMNVLGVVRKEYTVDPDRVYLMGHSMGGGGTVHLAIKYPDVWAALCPIAPALLRPAADVAKIKHLPVILIQGDNDRLCPVSTARRWVDEMRKNEMTVEYVEVAGGDHGSVAAPNLPKMFEFFDKHPRKAK